MNSSKVPFPSKVDDCNTEKAICDIWQGHFKAILNGTGFERHKTNVMRFLTEEHIKQVVIRPENVVKAIPSAVKLEAK